MKLKWLLVLGLVGLLGFGGLMSLYPGEQQDVAKHTAKDIQIYFSPKGGCTEAIVKEINAAKEIICVQAYSFTSEPIAQALVDATRRGVLVEVILDKSQRSERYSQANMVYQANISTLIDARHAIAHNKIILLDSKVIITGSFNFSKNAEENNAENLLIIKDHPDLVKQYEANYFKHREHSEEYLTKNADTPPATKPPEAKDDSGTKKGDTEEVTVYITRTGSKYHRSECQHLAKSKIPIKLKDAKAKGYEPCKVCKPPE
ncbi:MAG: phospholipase D family protein [Planctomycetes bacterium]|nr:phospholipase D family protein [Planctomycetota bacterium]